MDKVFRQAYRDFSEHVKEGGSLGNSSEGRTGGTDPRAAIMRTGYGAVWKLHSWRAVPARFVPTATAWYVVSRLSGADGSNVTVTHGEPQRTAPATDAPESVVSRKLCESSTSSNVAVSTVDCCTFLALSGGLTLTTRGGGQKSVNAACAANRPWPHVCRARPSNETLSVSLNEFGVVSHLDGP